jgi:GGDEF domain-containing protein
MLLIEVARRLQLCVRQTDTVARFGGDEFVILITDMDADESSAHTQAESIAKKFFLLWLILICYRLTTMGQQSPSSIDAQPVSASSPLITVIAAAKNY